MGLKTTIQKATGTAFKAAGDLAEQVRYEQDVTTEINTSTDVASVVTKSYFISAIFTDYNAFERQSSLIEDRDQKVLVQQASVTFVPGTNDKIHRVKNETSVEYELVDYSDPGGYALYVMQLRE